MNINNIKVGQTIKNYKELCLLLEIKHSSGEGKKNQLKELCLYCNYHTEGHKYIIDSIIDQPVITLNDILKTRNSKYIYLLSNNILEYLYNYPNELKQIPLIKLFTILGITNNNYKNANNYRKELSQLYNIQLASIYYFYDNTKNQFKKIIERCLNNLQSRSVLFWSKCIMIVKDGKTFKADKQTKELILDTQKEILQELKLNNMYELMKDKSKMKQFNKLIQLELRFTYYYAYDITTGNKAIQIEYDNIKQNKDKVNKLMIDKTNKLFSKDLYIPFKKEYELLNELLISLESENIKEELLLRRDTNKELYKHEITEEEKRNNKAIENIKNKYFDTYKD